jgi:hypothetical protein
LFVTIVKSACRWINLASLFNNDDSFLWKIPALVGVYKYAYIYKTL